MGDASSVIVDAHNDVLLELVVRRGRERSFELVLRRGDERLFERYWLPRLEAGGIGIQVCPLYAADAPRDAARERALNQASELTGAVAETAERVCQVRTRTQLDDSRLRLVLSMEGVEPLEGDPDAFAEWYERGVRSASLTWNGANEFAGGIDTPTQGITERGRRLIRHFGKLGVILDLAHASEQTWRDVLEEDMPFSVTHAGCRAVHDHPRNLADWQLEALAERHGVLGVMALGFAVDPEAPTVSRWLDHVDHAVSVMGIDHVGLGADFVDQASETGPSAVEASAFDKSKLALEGFVGPEDYPVVVGALRERGYTGDRLEAITSGNWLRILRESLPA